ncbi:MAG: DUF4275 family protein [Myxococcota bacterium]
MEPNVEAAVTALEEHLRAQGATVTRLQPREFAEARAKWRHAYRPSIGAKRWSWEEQRYDWHVFSLEHHESLEGGVATQAFQASTIHQHRFVVLSARDDVEIGLEVVAPHAIDLEALDEDWTMTTDDLSWSMSWTSDVEGPYFARP